MSLRNENTQADQTEFIEQVPFFEHQSHGFFHLKDFKKNKNLRPFYVLIALFFLILFIFVMTVIFKKNPDQEAVVNKVEKNVKLDPLNQRVYELRENLKDHDPTKQSLPFPQVDLEFNIN